MQTRDASLLLLLSAIWGSAFLFNHVVVRDVPPFMVVAGRLVIAACIVAPIAARNGGVLPPRTAWATLLFLAVVNNVIPFTLITAAQQHISSSLAATLIATMPLFVLMFTFAAGTERPDAERVVGLLIGFVGAAVVVGPDAGDITGSSAVGDLAVIAAAACYGLSTVVARQKAHGAALSLASGQMIFGALVAVPLALGVDGAPDLNISLKAALSWLGLGALCSGMAYVIFFSLLQRMSATQVSVTTYIIPIVAALLGWLVLDESIGVNLAAGLALIVVGVAGVNGGLRRGWTLVRGAGAEPGAGVPGG
ncbi:MAG: DMT family transporter [Chloroflexi bacterium]|nr:DMT family transporter [Chloroflexota bacterium]